MATKKRSAKGKRTKQQPARRGARGGAAGGRKRPAGNRKVRQADAARVVRPARRQPAAGVTPATNDLPPLRLAAPAPDERFDVESSTGRGAGDLPDDADRQAAELARRIEEAAGTAGEDLRRRSEAASAELARRREEETRARVGEDELPGAAAIAVELAVGALRLARAMATAPLRIGLAFLRPREA